MIANILLNRFRNNPNVPLFDTFSWDRFACGEEGRVAIRGREQQLIDSYGGIKAPNLFNKIRAVSINNPLGRLYHQASNEAFGELYQYTGN